VSATPKTVLAAITARDGHQSAWTGQDVPELVPQHRQGGMGGRLDKHRLSNVVWLESLLNGSIESDPELQSEAERRGIKISLHTDPEHAPIQYPDGSWWLLRDDGTRVPYIFNWENPTPDTGPQATATSSQREESL